MANYGFFPVLTEELYEKAEIVTDKYTFSYKQDNVEYDLDYDNENDEYILLDNRNRWNAREFNLKFCSHIHISNPGELFGVNGIVPSKTKINIALQWKCKGSNKRNTHFCFSFGSDDLEVDHDIIMSIKPDQLRDSVKLSIIMLVGDVEIPYSDEKFLANTKGIILGTFNEAKVMLEGKGSEFPVCSASLGENSELWRLEYNTDDPRNDKFIVENIALVLNKDHSCYKLIDENNLDVTSALFKEIFSSSIVLILLNLQQDDILKETKESDDFEEGSICAAMHYFIRTFDIDITDVNTMTRSIKRNIDRVL